MRHQDVPAALAEAPRRLPGHSVGPIRSVDEDRVLRRRLGAAGNVDGYLAARITASWKARRTCWIVVLARVG